MKIVIPGDPIHQPRLRHFSRGGKSLCYDPSKKDKDCIKSMLQDFLDQNYPSYCYPKNPKISIFFYCEIPKSMPKKLRFYAEKGMLRKRTKPDADNYIKLYFDCLNEIILEDDSQASLGMVDKFFHKDPKTVMYIDECDEILNMPVYENQHSLESCEWIRATMGFPHDSICRPYLN